MGRDPAALSRGRKLLLRRIRAVSPFLGLLALAALLVPGCPAHVDYGGRQRLTDHTAYTLPPGDGLVGVGLVGTQMDNLLASMRLEWSPFVPGLEIGTNLAHDALPALNFYAKYTALDSRWVGLGFRLGFKWLDFGNTWLLKDGSDLDETFGGAEMFMVPMSMTASFPLADWFSFHAELSYTYTPFSGELVLDGTHYNGGIVWHELTLNPTLHFYPGRGVALLVGVQLPLYSALFGEGYQELTSLDAPGVRYGLQASLRSEFDVWRLVTPWVGIHLAWESFNLRLTATWGLRFFESTMFDAGGALAYIPIPGFEMFWRF